MLTLLVPDIVEAILDGRQPEGNDAARADAAAPGGVGTASRRASWLRQRSPARRPSANGGAGPAAGGSQAYTIRLGMFASQVGLHLNAVLALTGSRFVLLLIWTPPADPAARWRSVTWPRSRPRRQWCAAAVDEAAEGVAATEVAQVPASAV
jgi:hypothetical protein